MKKKEDFTETSTEPSTLGSDPAEGGTMPASQEPEIQATETQAGSGSQAEAADGSASGPATGSTAAESPASGTTGGSAASSGNSPEEKIADLEAKLAEANDNYLRKAADFENFRKRMNQEKLSAIEYANQMLLLDLASVVDDFERAIKSAETQREAAGADSEKIAASFNSLHEGISMIEKNLLNQLENKWGLKRFDSAGEPFDPNKHEAIMMEKSAEQEEPVVAEEFMKGYFLKERVIRPAKVKVIMPEK